MDLYLDDWIFFGLVWDLWYANSLANSKPTGVAGIRLGTQNPWLGTAMPWRWMKMHGFAAVLHHIDNIFQINRCVLFDVVLQDLRGPVYYCMIIRTDFVIYHCAFCLNVARIFTWISLNVFSRATICSFKFRKLHPWHITRHHGQLKGCICWFKPLNLLRVYFSVQIEAGLF